MSEEWTEVEWRNPGGWMESTVRFRYRSVGNDELYEVVQHVGEGRASLDGFSFAAGMEAARQEIRERVQSGIGLAKHLIETQRMDEDLEAVYHGHSQALESVLEILSPPDSETES